MTSSLLGPFTDLLEMIVRVLPLLFGIYMIRNSKNYAHVAFVSLGVTAANYILTTLFSSIVTGHLLFPTWHVVFNLLNPFFDFRILLAVLEVFALLVTCYVVFVKPNEVTS